MDGGRNLDSSSSRTLKKDNLDISSKFQRVDQCHVQKSYSCEAKEKKSQFASRDLATLILKRHQHSKPMCTVCVSHQTKAK